MLDFRKAGRKAERRRTDELRWKTAGKLSPLAEPKRLPEFREQQWGVGVWGG